MNIDIKYGIIIDGKVYEAVAIDPSNNPSSYAYCYGCTFMNKCD